MSEARPGMVVYDGALMQAHDVAEEMFWYVYGDDLSESREIVAAYRNRAVGCGCGRCQKDEHRAWKGEIQKFIDPESLSNLFPHIDW
ncbi:hypothetical protein COW99_01725 [Candidatus Roizmanbacteria bacterium CG22_combo_CG10-13_8_21_14_all_38_20]|uniref:Uncharacterized protein n=1 Tax=Candidatus Roizmanbacteria bacterium CG22_combo_CG10-13_8_21_14_all_38_20 TaxID=1974862 RepID=A0A2H0BWE3_9BACT|nr:hypothetical protein [Candidatus Microgenomates bacterium]PIP61924.1 MAG: hypothetical protein COW99_01725 [Candidatus Roizmanbacteria bacterium CG22_combo_CG10-13_8_21_14_all_38_20]PJC32101.1 MAG: hypothetical protein CO050_01230 [Candidatus Roizmanbacteria bacterium CG_4_9_14_0_2_um_filter_38_17]